MLLQDLSYEVAPAGERRVRDVAVSALRLLSRALDALAQRVAFVPVPRLADPVLEFYGDASAPEGALYVDGQLVGHVLGVNRL